MMQALFRRGLAAGLALALLGLTAAWAEGPAPARAAGARSFLVLVGISDYADKKIKPRKHAETDARALRDLFADAKYLGVPKENTKLLLGNPDDVVDAQKATRANILEALKWVADKAGPKDLVLIGFLGRGGPLGDAGDRRCYFASDSTFAGRDKDAISAGEIEKVLGTLKGQRVCFLLDTDFTGIVTDGGARAVAEPTLGKAPYREFLGDDGSEDHAPKPGRIVYLPTSGLHTSLDLEKHGLFTQALLTGLKGGADREGYEPDGLVTVDELSTFLDKEFQELARKYGKTEKEKQQYPVVLGGRDTHFVLTSNPAVAATVRDRLAKFDKLVKDGVVPAKLADEGRALLERMPKLKAKQELRKAYQKLADGKVALAAFETQRETILEGLVMRRGDALAFAHKVIEVTQLIREKYIKEIPQGDMVNWAVRGLYRYVDEKVPEGVEAKLKDAKKMREGALTLLLTEARQKLGKREDLDGQKDLNVTLQRMLAKLDPYTTFIDPETLKKFKDDIQGNFTGIGVQIRKDVDSDQLLVVTPLKGSPAYKAKLMAGDLITHVVSDHDDKGKPVDPPRKVATKGLSISKAVKIIQGPPNTPVTLTIQREGAAKPFDVTITRGQIEVESVLGHQRKANDDWSYMIDKENKIGYIRLTNFAKNSFRDLARVVEDLNNEGMRGFILDLRFNPGGLLQSAIDITDLFIDDGLIVSIRPRVGGERRFRGRRAGSLLDFPMVVLVNGYSASGSEIVAAALQDHHRALVIGERSYGKGSVQNIEDFEGGEVKLTTATFWRPNNRNLNKASTEGKDDQDWGVVPDRAIKLSAKERDELAEAQRNAEIIERPDKRGKARNAFEDRQLNAALAYLRGQIKVAARR